MNTLNTHLKNEDREMKILFQELFLLQILLDDFQRSHTDFEMEVEALNDAIEFLMESLIGNFFSED